MQWRNRKMKMTYDFNEKLNLFSQTKSDINQKQFNSVNQYLLNQEEEKKKRNNYSLAGIYSSLFLSKHMSSRLCQKIDIRLENNPLFI